MGSKSGFKKVACFILALMMTVNLFTTAFAETVGDDASSQGQPEIAAQVSDSEEQNEDPVSSDGGADDGAANSGDPINLPNSDSDTGALANGDQLSEEALKQLEAEGAFTNGSGNAAAEDSDKKDEPVTATVRYTSPCKHLGTAESLVFCLKCSTCLSAINPTGITGTVSNITGMVCDAAATEPVITTGTFTITCPTEHRDYCYVITDGVAALTETPTDLPAAGSTISDKYKASVTVESAPTDAIGKGTVYFCKSCRTAVGIGSWEDDNSVITADTVGSMVTLSSDTVFGKDDNNKNIVRSGTLTIKDTNKTTCTYTVINGTAHKTADMKTITVKGAPNTAFEEDTELRYCSCCKTWFQGNTSCYGLSAIDDNDTLTYTVIDGAVSHYAVCGSVAMLADAPACAHENYADIILANAACTHITMGTILRYCRDCDRWIGTVNVLGSLDSAADVSGFSAPVENVKYEDNKIKAGTFTYTCQPDSMKYTYSITDNVAAYIDTSATGTLKVSKTWDDHDNINGYRPQSVTLKLHMLDSINGTAADNVIDTATVAPDADGNWTCQWENLPLSTTDGSAEAQYYVEETEVSQYTAKYSTGTDTEVTSSETAKDVTVRLNETTPQNIEVTNTPVNTRDVTGRIVWSDELNIYGIRPESVTIHLYANGVELAQQAITVTAEDIWIWSWTNLPKFNDDGTEIVYTISEDAISDYDTTIVSTTQENGTLQFTVTNTIDITYGNLTISKKVTGNLGSKTKYFLFTFTLSDNLGSKIRTYTYTGSYSGTIRSGDKVALKHGEYITILGIPNGTKYTVTESGNYGYTVYVTGNTGTISGNSTSHAAFTNNRSSVPKTGDNSHLGVWYSLLGVFGAGMIGSAFLGKRKKHKDGEK